MLWLASDEARYVTGVTLPVDAGFTAAVTTRPPAPNAASATSDRRVRSSAAAASSTSCSRRSSAGRDILLEGPPGTSQVDDAARDHRQLGHAVRAGRGQRRADARAAGRPPQPGPGAARGLQRRQLRARPAGRGDASAAGSSTSRSSTGRRRTRSTCCSARWPSARSRCRASARSPRLPTFRVLASMNPFDNVGTARISDSVYDRWCRLAVGYQDAAEEADIVAVRTGCADERLVADAVAITRATRAHPELRRGSQRARRHRPRRDRAWSWPSCGSLRRPRAGWCSTRRCSRSRGGSASTRPSEATPEEVITEIWENHFFSRPRRAAPGRPPVRRRQPDRAARPCPRRARPAAPRSPSSSPRRPRSTSRGRGAAGRRRRPRRPRHRRPRRRPRAGRACW